MDETVQKKDFIEMSYTGYANGEVFDSNKEEDLKKLNPKAKLHKTVFVVGEGMIVGGLDRALEGKEIGKGYEITLSAKDAFGERKKELLKTLPMSAFREKNFTPAPGMVVTLDNIMAKIIVVSGGRVIIDLNNPLAGKEIRYQFVIVRKVTDEKEKIEALFEVFFKFVPEYTFGEKIIVKGVKQLEMFVQAYQEKFKELIGKELIFEEKKNEKSLEKKSL